MTIETENLDALLAEVKPEFDEFYNKIEEVELKIRVANQEIEEAEKNYNVDELDSLANRVETLERIGDRVREDLERHREEVNLFIRGEKESLSNKVREAREADIVQEVEKPETQKLYTDIEDLEEQLAQAKKALEDKRQEIKKAIVPAYTRFDKYYNRGFKNHITTPLIYQVKETE